LSESDGETLGRLAGEFSEQDLVRFFSLLTKSEQDIRVSAHPRFQLELGLLKLLHAKRLYLLEDALARIGELEARLGANPQSASNQQKSAQFAPQRPASGGAPVRGSTEAPVRGSTGASGSARSSSPQTNRPAASPVADRPAASSWTRKYEP